MKLYRYSPLPVVQETASKEASNCEWCQWKGWRPITFCDCIRRCLHPQQISSRPPNVFSNDNIGTCNDWNRRGDCKRYTPTILTRLLQLAPKRLPTPEQLDKPKCTECRWRGLRLDDGGTWCLHPKQRHESPEGSRWIMGLCEEWNAFNRCQRFEPKSIARHPVRL